MPRTMRTARLIATVPKSHPINHQPRCTLVKRKLLLVEEKSNESEISSSEKSSIHNEHSIIEISSNHTVQIIEILDSDEEHDPSSHSIIEISSHESVTETIEMINNTLVHKPKIIIEPSLPMITEQTPSMNNSQNEPSSFDALFVQKSLCPIKLQEPEDIDVNDLD